VELRLGGPYEIYFVADSPPGLRGSEDCRILSYVPMKMLAFEWNAPPSFGNLRYRRTQVIVRFDSHAGDVVKVSFAQLGWGTGEEWDRLFDYFDRAWGYVLGNLKKRFEQGPLDWDKSD